jgi:DeoR family ulaG and ulaABCDEF operon transcriptional repressor
MIEQQRHHSILRIIADRPFVGVTQLADALNASLATVRRDLNALARGGHLKRVRGGAQACRHDTYQRIENNVEPSRRINWPQKRTIARAAAELVRDGQSIFINGGTTTFAMSEFLFDHELDILTNSIAVGAALLNSRNRITLCGGTIFREQNIILSPFDADGAENYWGDLLFTGCYAVNGLFMMETDPLNVQAIRKLLKHSSHWVVLADSSKLRRTSSMIVAKVRDIDTLKTDDGITDSELTIFADAGVKVIVVSVSEMP